MDDRDRRCFRQSSEDVPGRGVEIDRRCFSDLFAVIPKLL
jgi:hypothetical protein